MVEEIDFKDLKKKQEAKQEGKQVSLSGVPSSEQLVLKKRGRKPGSVVFVKKKSVRLGRFDLDALKAIMAGKSVDEISKSLGVDQLEASKRFQELVDAGYLVRSEGGFKLGIDGYNKIGFKLLKEPRKALATQFVSTPIMQEQKAENILSRQNTGKVDLGELLRIGAPQQKMVGPPFVDSNALNSPVQKNSSEMTSQKLVPSKSQTVESSKASQNGENDL